jgi:hypothetical protein
LWESAGDFRRELAERLVALGAPAAIVTGGHGDPVDHLFGSSDVEIPVERFDVSRRTARGARIPQRSRRCLPADFLADAARGAAAAASGAVRTASPSSGQARGLSTSSI